MVHFNGAAGFRLDHNCDLALRYCVCLYLLGATGIWDSSTKAETGFYKVEGATFHTDPTVSAWISFKAYLKTFSPRFSME